MESILEMQIGGFSDRLENDFGIINLNEIDIVAMNDYEKHLIIAEVKRQAGNINMDELKQKATSLVCKLKDYHVEYRGLSMLDM